MVPIWRTRCLRHRDHRRQTYFLFPPIHPCWHTTTRTFAWHVRQWHPLIFFDYSRTVKPYSKFCWCHQCHQTHRRTHSDCDTQAKPARVCLSHDRQPLCSPVSVLPGVSTTRHPKILLKRRTYHNTNVFCDSWAC
jgi:hypothetical protein